VARTAEVLASAVGRTTDEIAAATTQNFSKLFGLANLD
jgi:Tat protein secretion system quality control protein TatD with DNase activity